MSSIRFIAGLLALLLLLPLTASAQTASSFRAGSDAQAASRVAAPTGSGSVFIPKVTLTDTSGNTATITTSGTVAIDQTTPGTTNGTAIAQVGATTVATGNGVTGAGSQRVTIASDNTAFSVNSTDGAKYNATPPSPSDGTRIDLQAGAKGSLHTEIWGLDQAAGMKVPASNADGQAVSGQGLWGLGYVFNGTTADRTRSVTNSTDSTGTGINAAGLVGQRDDTSPSSITENQFGNVRVGAQHQLLTNENGHYPYSAILGTPAVPVGGASGNVANANAVATLTGTATTTVYITGFVCTPGGSTAAALVDVAVTGMLGGTKTYTAGTPAGATLMGMAVTQTFYPAFPASAVNTPIVVTMPALGTGNAHAACVATGYYM